MVGILMLVLRRRTKTNLGRPCPRFTPVYNVAPSETILQDFRENIQHLRELLECLFVRLYHTFHISETNDRRHEEKTYLGLAVEERGSPYLGLPNLLRNLLKREAFRGESSARITTGR